MRLFSSASLTTLAVALSIAPVSVANAQQGEAEPIAQGSGSEGQSEADSSAEYDADTIVVLGARLFGQVETPVPPVLELTPEDIAAYGAGSISELIEALGPQVTSARGRGGGGFPVILVNGERISSFRELRSYPPEAIEKFEVFPEEVALQYGYSADQRVVNIILKENYSSREIEIEYEQPWDGGFSQQEVEATYLRIDGPSRLNVNLEWNNSSLLTEGERGIVQSGGVPDLATDPDPADFRSLQSDSAGLEGTVNWSTQLSPGNSLSVNATYERSDTLSLQGLDTVLLTDPADNSLLRSFNADDPLTVDRRSETFAGGTTLNLGVGEWQVTATADASQGTSRSLIERRIDTSDLIAAAAAGTLAIDGPIPAQLDGGFDEAFTKTNSASALVTARGTPLYLPAGDVNLTLDAGYNWNRIESEDTRNPGLLTTLKRGDLAAGVNLGIPLTSSVDDVLGAVGDITLNLTAGIDDLSDFGTLYDWSAGVTWGIGDNLSINASYLNRDTAPSLGQLGNPEIATQNVPVFDFVNNETVLVEVISGGNPLLPAQNQSDWKIGLQYELPFLDRASFSVDYIRNKSSDVAAGFPVLTPETEAAFPDRITRDGSGMLVQLDQRPVTYARQDEERLQFNFNISGEISGGDDGDDDDRSSRSTSGPANGGPAVFAGGSQEGGAAGFEPNPERFAQMRASFCGGDAEALRIRLNEALASAAAGEAAPDGMNIPPQMLQRIAGDDGRVDAEEIATLRSRMCSGDGPGIGGGQGGTPMDPERVAELRATFCEADAEVLRGQFNRAIAASSEGQPLSTGPSGEEVTIPPQMLQAMGGEDGHIDEQEFAAMRERVCNPEAAAQQEEGEPEGGAPGAGERGQRGGGGDGNRGGGGGPRAGGGGPPGLPFGRGRGGNGGGRWFLNIQYNLELANEVQIADGGPILDLLDGDALSGGGQPRHTANFRLGTFYNGFGMFWTGSYTGSSSIDGTGLPGSTNLRFNDIFKLDVRAFADLGQQQSLVDAVPLLADTRIGIGVDNIFDARQRVTDSTGTVPLRYQPFLIDPVGRSFELEIRKLF